MPEPSRAKFALEPDAHQERNLWFLVPGDLNTPTGGYRYDRRIMEGLRALGRQVEYRILDASFPQPTLAARDEVHGLLAGIPDGETVVVDGLAFGALPEVAESHGRRLGLIALVHHPLWLETGLDPRQAGALRASETRALAQARRVIVTSPATARLLQDHGVPADRIRVVTPGVDPAPAATGSAGPDLQLLCVATLTPRKGHDVLLRALAPLAPLPWHLHCVGSLDRDRHWAAELLRLRRDLGLDERVSFTGALGQAELDQRYRPVGSLRPPHPLRGLWHGSGRGVGAGPTHRRHPNRGPARPGPPAGRHPGATGGARSPRRRAGRA